MYYQSTFAPHKKRFISRGFTIIELLVVIAILVVLAALLFLGVSKGLAMADRTTAGNNLRQLQIANGQYANENGGLYIAAWAFDDRGRKLSNWFNHEEFLGYLRGPVDPGAPASARRSVPKSLLDPVVLKANHSRSERLEKSFGLNITTLPGGKNNTRNSVRQLRRGQLINPSQTCAFITAMAPFATESGKYRYEGFEVEGGNQSTAYRHNDHAQCVYYDGHLELKSMKDMREMDKREDNGRPSLFWKGFE